MKFLSLLLVLLVSILFTACDEPLDFNNSQFYDVQDILESSNCTADCEEEADCENQRVKMIATIDASGISATEFQFVVQDRSTSTFEMEVKVDTVIAAELFANILDKGGEVARLQGRLGGEDGSSSSNCQRVIFMTIDDPADVEIVE